jgi:hypothetical protein
VVATVDHYEESYWEIYDSATKSIIAHFFDEKHAEAYSQWLNSRVCSATSATG